MRNLKTMAKESRTLPLRIACGVFWSLKNSLRHGRLIRVYRRRDGLFVNHRPDAVLVSPEVNALSLQDVSHRIDDEWLTEGALDAGDIVLDIGAGIGDEVVVFSRRVGERGRVVAVEAHPGTFACLSETAARSGLPNVALVNAAISDAPGTLSMQSGESYLTGKLVANGQGDVSVDAITIPILLDRLGIDVVDFLKMNIEGAELAALQGCKGHFQRIRRMVVSCHDFIADGDPAASGMRTYRDVIALLSTNGYRVTHGREDPRPWVRYYVYASRA